MKPLRFLLSDLIEKHGLPTVLDGLYLALEEQATADRKDALTPVLRAIETLRDDASNL